ncbi:MAG TPA: hypothetical protein VE338_05295 [Ktedonobacterales bacterium]|jgi:hypothetical protein|nr:hypothetical protein [Ktedonobacterales bacterium]
MERHEIPTHLHVEDKLLGSLTVRQTLYLCIGLSLSYGLWQQLGAPGPLHALGMAALPLRVFLSALPTGFALLCALLRPAQRPLEEWIFVALRYLSLPKATVWRASASTTDTHALWTIAPHATMRGLSAADAPDGDGDDDGDDDAPEDEPPAALVDSEDGEMEERAW